MTNPERYEIGTVAMPAYIVLYRNSKTTSRWYVHRGYSMNAEAEATAETFRHVGMDAVCVPLSYSDELLTQHGLDIVARSVKP